MTAALLLVGLGFLTWLLVGLALCRAPRAERSSLPAPLGAKIGLTYDWRGEGRPPGVGDWLRTSSGRCYLIVSVCRVASKVSALRAVVLEAQIGADDLVYPLAWDRRSSAPGPLEPPPGKRPREQEVVDKRAGQADDPQEDTGHAGG